MKILHFDDSPSCRALFNVMAKQVFGHEADVYERDQIITAPIEITMDRPDMIVIDWFFPHGITCPCVFKRLETYVKPVIIWSGHNLDDMKREIRAYFGQIPPNVHIIEKVKPTELRQKLEELREELDGTDN